VRGRPRARDGGDKAAPRQKARRGRVRSSLAFLSLLLPAREAARATVRCDYQGHHGAAFLSRRGPPPGTDGRAVGRVSPRIFQVRARAHRIPMTASARRAMPAHTRAPAFTRGGRDPRSNGWDRRGARASPAEQGARCFAAIASERDSSARRSSSRCASVCRPREGQGSACRDGGRRGIALGLEHRETGRRMASRGDGAVHSRDQGAKPVLLDLATK